MLIRSRERDTVYNSDDDVHAVTCLSNVDLRRGTVVRSMQGQRTPDTIGSPALGTS